MGGKHSRNKGARSERQLRDELIRQGWRDVVRVPLSGAVKTRDAYQDDVVGFSPCGKEYRFENKARSTGFDSIYNLFTKEGQCYTAALPTGELIRVSLDPNLVIGTGTFIHFSDLDPKVAKMFSFICRRCQAWMGNADILSLKQDRKPFIYVRYYR